MLTADFDKIFHVESTDLPIPATDIEIWKYAKQNDFIIVTNDEDYYHLLLQKGFPPKVILLKIGNQSTKNIATLLIKHKLQIQNLSDTSDYGLLEVI